MQNDNFTNDQHLSVTDADLGSGVEMGKINDGYFSNPHFAQQFIDIGIKPYLDNLGTKIRYAGFGGGEGFLTYLVSKYISSTGRDISTLVVDANGDYLAKAKQLGLQTLCADIAEAELAEQDLITMRSVNHYSSLSLQKDILNNIHRALKPGGVLVSQNLSGPSDAYCRLASGLSRIEALGRVVNHPDTPHMSSEKEFMGLLEASGFKDMEVFGYAHTIKVSPLYYWTRFNGHHYDAAKASADIATLAALEKQRQIYLQRAKQLIEDFLDQASDVERQLIRADGASYIVTLTFPVFGGRRSD